MPKKGYKQTEAHKRKIGDGNRGKKRIELTKKKISDILKRRKIPETTKKKISDTLKGRIGENHSSWKGNEAGTNAKHMWIKKYYPQKEICNNKCEICDKFNLNLDLAQFRHINIRNIEDPMIDYMYICPYPEKDSCHRIYDKLTVKQKKKLLNGTITREEKLKRVNEYIIKVKSKKTRKPKSKKDTSQVAYWLN